MKKNLRLNRSVIATLVGFTVMLQLIAGCKKAEQQSSPPPVAKPEAGLVKPQAKAVQRQASSAASLPTPTAQFDFSTKKDPFKPYVIVKAPTLPTADKTKKTSGLPIHSFEVSQFKLIGVVTGEKGNQAMVTDPAGKGYVLKVGMTMGPNNGRVTAITTNGVEVREQFKDDNGRVRKEIIKLTLPRKY
ncbi:pilus assembly protein PilP [Pelotalea chapellei]|uniref:Pilus assembly protein PilP n=1 Tax=Pelotalea chapellei TaxID=44671 RepID=A0ABS5U462_9BACT|nr:pilus assembly protein PilP [Pelotalea chapellei]MBT1070448.1 pilus assembly protein PilP [Pelotalea chapellei]